MKFAIAIVYLFHSVLAALEDVECPGYRVDETHSSGDQFILSLRSDGKSSPDCVKLGQDYTNLQVSLDMETESRVHVTIRDVEGTRWIVPNSIINRPGRQFDSPNERLYSTAITKEQFGFSVTRRIACNGDKMCDGPVLFNTTKGGLVFKEQYMELTTELPLDANIYGLGETVASFRRDSKNSRTTIWSRDAATPVNENVYGSHPFYIELRDGKAHGVFFVSSTGMDVIMSPGKLTYKSIGGIFEFYILLGPTPQDVLKQYTEIVGKPAMISPWTLGWHQCRWGYSTVEEVEGVVTSYNRSRIPLEAMWIDIDYMDGYRDFTFDPRRFSVSKMRAFQKRLQDDNQKLVLIVDPGIKIDAGYPAYDEGMKENVFIKNPRSPQNLPFVGNVWPGETHFPDWFNPKTLNWWTRQIEKWFEMIPIDGIWIDMNEIANFCERGDCKTPTPARGSRMPSVDWSKFRGVGTFSQSFNPHYPEYSIDNGGNNQHLPLHFRTSAMDALHYNNTIEYFVHNLYGHMEGEMTYKALKQLRPNERPFILSRSTFAGSGRFMAHWLGDNWSTWESMRYSISGLFSFTSVYSIPMVGADICGFLGNSDEELCRRWTQLGAVAYPFARNHNWNEGRPQEPYLWPSVAESARRYIQVRYELLPYWYTLFYRASEFGETHVVRPLAWEFSDPNKSSEFDASQVLYIDRQLMVGPALLVVPVLEPGTSAVRAFIPKGVWYKWENGRVAFDHQLHGSWLDLHAPYNHIPIFIRGGYILPLHNDIAHSKTRDIWSDGRLGLVAALDPYAEKSIDGNHVLASGEMYLDNEAGLHGIDSAGSKTIVSATVSLENGGTRRFKSIDGHLYEANVYNIWVQLKSDNNYDLMMTSKNSTIDRIRLYGVDLVIETMENSISDGADFMKFSYQDAYGSGVILNSLPVNLLGVYEPLNRDRLIGLASQSLSENLGMVELRWERHAGLSVAESQQFFISISGRARLVK